MAKKTEQVHLISDYTKPNTCSFSTIMEEMKSLMMLAFPIAITALIFYSRSMVSMMFLGYLGELELAAGSLAIAFANITGYSVLSGLSLGMEPLCSQAFGANRPKLLSLTLQRCILFLLLCSIPISFMWLNMSQILIWLHQNPKITTMAHTYLIFSLPDPYTYLPSCTRNHSPNYISLTCWHSPPSSTKLLLCLSLRFHRSPSCLCSLQPIHCVVPHRVCLVNWHTLRHMDSAE